jgi:predicted XRE-type DNA-binding protein
MCVYFINHYIIQQKMEKQKILDAMAVDIPKINLFLIC